MTHLPPPLETRHRPAGPPPVAHLWAKFLAGLGGGTGVSALVWVLGWDRLVDQAALTPILFFGLPLIKIALATVAVCYRAWRPLGIGLFISVPLGGLLFFIGCAANL